MNSYEVVALSRDLSLKNNNTGEVSKDLVKAITGQFVTALCQVTSKLDSTFAEIELGENRAIIRYGINNSKAVEGELINQEDELRHEVLGRGSGFIQLIQPTEEYTGLLVRLSK